MLRYTEIELSDPPHPTQWWGTTVTVEVSFDVKLRIAVIAEAINRIRKGAKTRLARQAWSWFFSDDRSPDYFAFLDLADFLNIDAHAFRARLLRGDLPATYVRRSVPTLRTTRITGRRTQNGFHRRRRAA